MSIIDILKVYSQDYASLITNFFAWYNSIGRHLLDFLHNIFQSVFNVLLFAAFLVSLLYLVMSAYSIFKRRENMADDGPKGELPFVTVQIPTFNELAAIRCAKSCMDFDYPKDRYEIIIGDDSNDKSVSKKLGEFAAESKRIKLLKRETNAGFKPGNLNNMLKHTKGEIIVIFDSDFIPNSEFLRKIVAPFMKDKNIAAAQARWNLINSNQNLITSLGATIVSTCHHVTIPFMYSRRKLTFLCGSAEAVRKDVLLKLGSWENGNLTEDIEFSLRILENGYRIAYLHDLECDSEVPFTLKDLYKQQMRWAYGVIYSWKKHFFTMAKSRHLTFIDKVYMQGIFLSGYLLSTLLAGLFITGTLSFITHAPAPMEWGKFFYEMSRNILLTSGLIIASIIALAKAKKSRLTLSMLASSFSYGIVVTYYVNVGIFKALAKVPMEWFMLKKQGNEIVN